MTFIKVITKDLIDDIVDIVFSYKFTVALVPLTWFIDNIQRYMFNDWQYVGFLASAIFLNVVSKFWDIIKGPEKFSVKIFGTKLIDKTIKYMIILGASHILESYEIKGVANEWFSWLPSMLMAIPIIMEVDSMFQNIGIEVSGKLKELFDSIKSVVKTKESNGENND